MIRFKAISTWNVSTTASASGESPWFADLTNEECDRYLRWWRKFRTLRHVSWLGIGLLIFTAYFGSRYYPSDALGKVLLFAVVLIFVTRVWLRVLVCPRCGATYSGGWISILNRFLFLSHCYGCDLTTDKLAQLQKHARSTMR